MVKQKAKENSHPHHLKAAGLAAVQRRLQGAIYSLRVPSPASRSLIVAQPRANPQPSHSGQLREPAAEEKRQLGPAGEDQAGRRWELTN